MSSNPRKKRNTGKRRRSPYTVGEINKLIDVLVHPLAEKDKSLIIVDGVLHALKERNPPRNLRNFIKYNLPEIVKKMQENSRNQA